MIHYKDDATAFNGEKKGNIAGKGELNNSIATIFFELLKKNGVESHFIKKINDNEQLVFALEMIPVEVVVRNVAAGSLAKRVGLEEGTVMPKPVLEWYLKNDDLGDPWVNEYHIDSMGWATREEIDIISKTALKINEILTGFLREKNLDLIDFKLEFGKKDGKILLGDEISPDTCRFWDHETKMKLDKDRFRRDLGGVEEAYKEILKRIS